MTRISITFRAIPQQEAKAKAVKSRLLDLLGPRATLGLAVGLQTRAFGFRCLAAFGFTNG